MATVVIDSADHYSTADIANGNGKYSALGAVEIQIGGARTGPQCIKLPAGTEITIGLAADRPSAGVGFYVASLPSATINLIKFTGADSIELFGVKLSSTGNLIASVNDFEVETSVGTVSTGSWFFLDIEATSNDSYVADVYRGSGKEQFLGGGGCPFVQTTTTHIGDPDGDVDLLTDDLYVNDDTGDIHDHRMGGDDFSVYCLRPVSSDTSQWTPNTGTNLSCVQDDTPDYDATYNESTNPGDIDLFEMTQGNIGSSQVVQVLPYSRAAVLGFTADSEIGAMVNIGGTPYQNITSTQTTQYSIYPPWILNLNPATGLAFTGADIDAARWGYYMGPTTDGSSRVTQFVIEVCIPSVGPTPTRRVRNFCF